MKKLTIAALPLLLAGCLASPPPWTLPSATPTRYVAVIGDSLTVETQETTAFDPTKRVLADDLTAAGDAVSVDAIIGASTFDMTQVPFTDGQFGPTPPTALIVALGTNDAHETSTGTTHVALTDSQTYLTDYIASSPAACVVLVNVNTISTGWGLDVTGPPYNAMLQSIADASGGRVHIADWASEAVAHPEYMDDQGGPHFSDAGTSAYRQLIESSAEGCA